MPDDVIRAHAVDVRAENGALIVELWSNRKMVASATMADVEAFAAMVNRQAAEARKFQVMDSLVDEETASMH